MSFSSNAVALDYLTPKRRVRPRAPGHIMVDTQRARAGRTFFLAVVAILLLATSAPARVACQTAKPPGAHDWWSWREVEHRQCWYPGRSGMSKAALYWPTATARQTTQAIPAPAMPLPARATPFAERWPR